MNIEVDPGVNMEKEKEKEKENSYENSLDILQTFAMFQERSVDPQVKNFVSVLKKGEKVTTFTFTDDIIRLEYMFAKNGKTYKSVITHVDNPNMVLRDRYINYGTICFEEQHEKNFLEKFQETLKSATNITNEKLFASIRIEFNKGKITNVFPTFVDHFCQPQE